MIMIAEWAKKAYDESTASDDAIIYSRWHTNLGYKDWLASKLFVFK